MIGKELLVRTTVDVDGGQVALVIVQVNVALVPAAIPVTPELNKAGDVIVAVPLVTVQIPDPIVGLFPAKVNVDRLHWAIAVPALDTVGKASLVRTTVDDDGGQVPLVIVQVNVALVPAAIPVTPELYKVGEVIVAVPLVTVHNPDPTVGLFPAKVNDEVLH